MSALDHQRPLDILSAQWPLTGGLKAAAEYREGPLSLVIFGRAVSESIFWLRDRINNQSRIAEFDFTLHQLLSFRW